MVLPTTLLTVGTCVCTHDSRQSWSAPGSQPPPLPQQPPPPPQQPPPPPPLPPPPLVGWQKAFSPAGDAYYWHPQTGEVSWSAPGSQPPPPPQQQPPPPPMQQPPAQQPPNDPPHSPAQSPSSGQAASSNSNSNIADGNGNVFVRYGSSPRAVSREVALMRREHFMLARELHETVDETRRQRVARTMAGIEWRLMERGFQM